MADHQFSRKFIDLTGQRFGRLTVVTRAPTKGTRTQWLCACDCGNTSIVASNNLRGGKQVSCSCLKREAASRRHFKHGQSGSRTRPHSKEYNVWCHAKRRCSNPKAKSYQDYGGRGITMCREWSESFAQFFQDMGPCPDGHSIDRINNDGHYEPGNCRWASPSVQANNKRNLIRVEYNGELISLAELSRRTGRHYDALRHRHANGIPLFAAPLKLSEATKREIYELYRCGAKATDIAEQYGVCQQTVYNAIVRCRR